jgi:hypothetical protein
MSREKMRHTASSRPGAQPRPAHGTAHGAPSAAAYVYWPDFTDRARKEMRKLRGCPFRYPQLPEGPNSTASQQQSPRIGLTLWHSRTRCAEGRSCSHLPASPIVYGGTRPRRCADQRGAYSTQSRSDTPRRVRDKWAEAHVSASRSFTSPTGCRESIRESARVVLTG